MKFTFEKWKKENPNEIKEKVNTHLKFLYLNKEVTKVHEIFNSEWSSYIDLSYEDGIILEFCGLLPDYKKTGYPIEELKFLVNQIEKQGQDKNLFKKAIHNILLSAVFYNNIKMINYITKEQKISEIDFSYGDGEIINNCFPKNNNPIKKEIMNYFILECNLKKTPEIESVLKKNKKKKILKVFEKISFYQELNEKLPKNENKVIKNKI